MDRLGVGYEAAQPGQPAAGLLRHLRLRPGRSAARPPAYDQIIQGMSGVMSITGDARPHPYRVGYPIVRHHRRHDRGLRHRGRAWPRGERTEARAASSTSPCWKRSWPTMGWVVSQLPDGRAANPAPLGNDNFTASPSGHLRHRRRAAEHRRQQAGAVRGADRDGGRPKQLKTDPRFQERDTRKKNRKALTPLLEARLKERPTAEWVEALNARGVPSGAILPPRAGPRPAPGRAPRDAGDGRRRRASARSSCSA